MILVSMLSKSETALICDFAEYYHVLNWRALPVSTSAALAAGLRDGSRSVMMLTGTKIQTDTALLASAVDRLGLLVWAKTKDGQKGKNKPKSIIDTLTRDTEKEKVSSFTSGDEFEAARLRLMQGR